VVLKGKAQCVIRGSTSQFIKEILEIAGKRGGPEGIAHHEKRGSREEVVGE